MEGSPKQMVKAGHRERERKGGEEEELKAAADARITTVSARRRRRRASNFDVVGICLPYGNMLTTAYQF